MKEVPALDDAVVLRGELTVRVQLLGQVVCLLVHHQQLLTEVERPPHREHVAVYHFITSNAPSLRLSHSKHTHELELIQPHMAKKPVLRGEVGCACVAREVSVERGGMGERGCARRLGGWVWV